MSETQGLAQWAADLKWEAIPDCTRIKVKHCILEFFSCCLVARNETPARLLLYTLKQLGGKPQATVLGHAELLSVEQAALINGAMGHIWEIDDTHRQTMSHPGDSVISAALAMGEWLESDTTSILAAIIAGYEVSIRICEAVIPSHLMKGWHPSGTTNTFGSAVAAGKLLGLSAKHMAWVLGLATTQAAGTFCHLTERAMTKDLNPGKAAANGVLSALLACQGFTGSSTAVENSRGFIHTHADKYDLSPILKGLGSSYKIDEIAFKPYSCCRHAHAAIDALLYLREQNNLEFMNVKSIIVKLYPMAASLVDDQNPMDKGFYGTRYSIQFNLALALIKGRKGMQRALLDQCYIQSMLEDSHIQEIMRKVEVQIDEKLSQDWPNKWPAEVCILMLNGHSYCHLVNYPLGEPEYPMDYDQLVTKFTGASKGYLNEAETKKTVEMVQRMESLVKISPLLELVGGKKQK